MLGELRQVAIEARLAAGAHQLDVATRAGVSQETVSRFERAEGWARDLDTLVAAYERESGLAAGTLWRRAVALAFD